MFIIIIITEFFSGQIERNAILECSPLCGFNSCGCVLPGMLHFTNRQYFLSEILSRSNLK